MPDLPVDIDTTYPDDAGRPDRKLHQQHHDALHARYNEENAETGALDGQTTPDFTALGVDGGRTPPAGTGSTLLGAGAGSDETGGANTLIGFYAGSSVVGGRGNVVVGGDGPSDPNIDYSVNIGLLSYCETDGDVAIGAGASNTVGGPGLAIGYNATTYGADAVAIGPNVSSDVGEVRLAHVKFDHVAGGLWSVEIDGTEYTIAVVPA